jgi:hypothetical protein
MPIAAEWYNGGKGVIMWGFIWDCTVVIWVIGMIGSAFQKVGNYDGS